MTTQDLLPLLHTEWRNRRTGRVVKLLDVTPNDMCLLSGGQIWPVDNFTDYWQRVGGEAWNADEILQKEG